MAHLPLLRHIRIRGGAESEFVETDIPDEYINLADDPDKNWKAVTPEVALDNIGPNYAGKIRDVDAKTLTQVGEMIRAG